MFEHLIELRKRLIITVICIVTAFVIAYIKAETICIFLVKPLTADTNTGFIYTGMADAFTTYIKLSFYTSLCISTPIIIAQIYAFAAPGLYKNEKKAFAGYVGSSLLLFIIGAFASYKYIMPAAWRFFIGFQKNMPGLSVTLMPKINDYLTLTINMIFAFGIAFQLPVFLVILARINLISYQALKRKRRIAIVLIFTISAVLTPPDIISQIGLALPLMILYELSIIACRYVNSNQQKNHDISTEPFYP